MREGLLPVFTFDVTVIADCQQKLLSYLSGKMLKMKSW